MSTGLLVSERWTRNTANAARVQQERDPEEDDGGVFHGWRVRASGVRRWLPAASLAGAPRRPLPAPLDFLLEQLDVALQGVHAARAE